ncbi:transmembrane anterior posterior transformation protein 1-like isoform X2 [Halichondria panicea]|uniref:transmembrane anterior posterior transformation protein 1-like isoform X2 n=1 Tax=Halichondria panicea TaxID=6063 RepID=UPI00312BCB75
MGMSLYNYVRCELTRGHGLKDGQGLFSEKQRRVTRFMKTPRELEKLMLFGFLIMLDAFLFVFTWLPLRALLSLTVYTARLLCCCRQRVLDCGQKIDILRVTLIVLCTVALGYVDTSALYHLIKGQSVIKLYVFFNMMEIFDRLLASIGQDTLDTLFGIVADNRKGKFEYLEALFYFVVATVYVFLHTTLILVQATTLNVAINSHSTVLLTIMMSNNFVELKGCVFKKFETNNLFQMSCSDIRERFHYVIMLGVVCVSNLSQFNWDLAYLKSVLPVVVMVMVLEVVVDSIKHAFITKFNDISPDVYKKYRTLLAMDLVTSRQDNLWNTLYQTFTFPGRNGAILLVVLYLCLLAGKVLLGITLLGKSCHYRSSPPPPRSHSSNDLIGQSSSHMTTQGSFIPPTQSSISDIGPLGQKSSEQVLGKKTVHLCSKCQPKPLAQVERFTLCSNRII